MRDKAQMADKRQVGVKLSFVISLPVWFSGPQKVDRESFTLL